MRALFSSAPPTVGLSVLLSSLSFLTASAALAEIGVLETVVEGFDDKAATARRTTLNTNIGTTLNGAQVKVVLACELGTFDAPPNAKCVKDAVSAIPSIDEVAQVFLRNAGPNKTVMKLRIYSRDGVPVQEPTQDIVDAEATEVTTAMLRKAFDPSRFSGKAIIRGAPADAELLVDGLRVDGTEVMLRVGHHVLDVVHPGGAVETVPFDILLDRSVSVAVPSAPIASTTSAGAPLYVSASTAGLGVASIVGSIILLVVATDNRDEWHRRAVGRTFPRNSDDPTCAAEKCNDGGEQIGWTRGYGPLGSDGVGQGARFMMVAFSRDNELRWDSSYDAAIGLAIAGSAAIVGGGLATFALWPSDAPPE